MSKAADRIMQGLRDAAAHARGERVPALGPVTRQECRRDEQGEATADEDEQRCELPPLDLRRDEGGNLGEHTAHGSTPLATSGWR